MATFTSDWVTHNTESWKRILGPLQGLQVSILEVGSFEGRSALYFLEHLPRSRITCVDPFHGAYEERFDANVAPLGDRVRKIKDRSIPALDRLANAGERFDVIYVDGDHRRQAAFADTIMAWPLLKVGGTVIWDDYMWERDKLAPEDRPDQAIDLFLATFARCLRVQHRGYQIIAAKTAEWPVPRSSLLQRSPAVAALWKAVRRRVLPPRRVREAFWNALGR